MEFEVDDLRKWSYLICVPRRPPILSLHGAIPTSGKTRPTRAAAGIGWDKLEIGSAAAVATTGKVAAARAAAAMRGHEIRTVCALAVSAA